MTSHFMLLVYYLLLQSDDAYNPERLYDLVAVVVHCGVGMNRGHYISLVKSHGLWLLFDDDNVDVSIYYFRTQVVWFGNSNGGYTQPTSQANQDTRESCIPSVVVTITTSMT